MKSVLGTIVCFQPDHLRLTSVIESIAGQCAEVLVVANEEMDRSEGWPTNVTLASSDQNLGLGSAYNYALNWADKSGFDHLLLLDQDTILPDGYVERLFAANAGSEAVAWGGAPVDHRVNGTERKWEETAWGLEGLVQTSGTVFDVRAALEAEGFDEALFIHHVDQEFFFRLLSQEKDIATYDVPFDHEPGRSVSNIPGATRQLREHSPTRFLYSSRNSLALLRYPHVPTTWALFQVARSFLVATLQARFGIGTVSKSIRCWLSGAVSGIKGLERRAASSSIADYPYEIGPIQ